MKFHEIIILFSLVFLIVGAASASENVTDDASLQLNESVPVEEDASQKEIAENINVTFEEQMWQEDLGNITVEMPDNATGEFCLKLNNEVIYNETIENTSFQVPVRLPTPKIIIIASIWPPMDCSSYKVSAFYNGIDLNLNKTLKVMRFSQDYNALNFPEEVLQYDYSYSLRYAMIIPRSANGIAEIYLDNRLLNRTKVTGPFLDLNVTEIAGSALGNHTLRIIYYNDTYYNSYDRSFNFTIVQALISIPRIVNLTHDSCISVRVLDNVSGTVSVYLDGALINRGTVKKDDYIVNLEEYLKCNSTEVTVIVETGEFSRSRTQKIAVAYDFDIYSSQSYVYGEKNAIEIYMPDHLNTNLLEVTINGTRYPFAHDPQIMNNEVGIDISRLPVGNYTMAVSYPGDDRFAAKNRTFDFSVRYDVIYPYFVTYGDDSVATLRLPGDASGMFSLYVDGVLFKSAMVENGIAEIGLFGISEGYHELSSAYAGEDYAVFPTNTTVQVEVKVYTDYRFTAGEDKCVSVEVSKNSTGYVIFTVDGKDHKVSVKSGIAKYSLKGLEVGEHDIDIEYVGDDGYRDFASRVVTVYNPKVKIFSVKAYTNGIVAKIKVLNNNNKPMANAKVTVKFNGKTYAVKTGKEGIATLKKSLKLKVKKYKLNAGFNGAKASKTVKAKNVLSLKSVSVKKSSKKVVLTATLKAGSAAIKNKQVTFKFNGKTFKAKTNSKGIAKVTVSNLASLKVGNTVKYQATYISTVSKSVKVQK